MNKDHGGGEDVQSLAERLDEALRFALMIMPMWSACPPTGVWRLLTLAGRRRPEVERIHAFLPPSPHLNHHIFISHLFISCWRKHLHVLLPYVAPAHFCKLSLIASYENLPMKMCSTHIQEKMAVSLLRNNQKSGATPWNFLHFPFLLGPFHMCLSSYFQNSSNFLFISQSDLC